MVATNSTKKSKKQSNSKAKSTSPIKSKKPSSKKGTIGKNPVENILAKMAEMDELGVKEVNEEELLKATGYSRHDSKGFRNASKEVVKVLSYVTKATKNKVTKYSLTDKGREHLIETGILQVRKEASSNEELHAQLKELLLKSAKAPAGKIESIFDTMKDGKWHTVEKMLSVSGYGRADSKGYRNIMKAMKDLDILEKSSGKVRFSDSFFKFGRP